MNCAKCPSLSQCTESKNHKKLIQRHIGELYVEEAEHLCHSYDIKQIYASVKKRLSMSLPIQRKSMECDGQPRGLKKLSMQAILTFATMNLKKLATWTWQAASKSSYT
ncbi:transposase [Lysinibacillus sphaericus]|uniref:transposase n=2 Tax=Lysinibacillus TaxID=400634 RepID=UPI0002E5E1E6|nr:MULTISPECIES: transposase [Lysinibacillus]MDR0159375.1 transposase [Lysinibacillus sphaericus]QPA48300.1 transposase [Lysinibacillus sphaericus]QTB16412.1 transposase [Lysinibacillus sphaericus]